MTSIFSFSCILTLLTGMVLAVGNVPGLADFDSQPVAGEPVVIQITVDGPISPVSADYIEKQIDAAADTHNNAFWDPSLRQYVGITRLWRDGQRVVGRTVSADCRMWTKADEVLRGLERHLQTYAMPVFRYAGVYLGLVALTALLQAAGIFLVVKGRYRVGGALQIAASCLHVLKGEGLIGVVGGLKARAHGRADAEPPAA